MRDCIKPHGVDEAMKKWEVIGTVLRKGSGKMIRLADSLMINQSYLIQSSVTKGLYLDADRCCYVFFSDTEAERFVGKYPDIEMGQKIFRNPQDLFAECYSAGALSVIIIENGQKETHKLNHRKVRRQFYNGDCNAAINLFKETKDVQYLRYVAACWFIVPIRINFEISPEIVYGTIHLKQNQYCFLAFSDMESYSEWDKTMVGWKPLLVNFDVMCQISKENGYIINPKGNALLLPANVMSKYRKYATVADPNL